MHFLCAACRQCDRQTERRNWEICGRVGIGVEQTILACPGPACCLHRENSFGLRCCLCVWAEKSGKEITDDKEMSENSFQLVLFPSLSLYAVVVVFIVFSLFSLCFRVYYGKSFPAFHGVG